MSQVQGKKQVHAVFCWENLGERDHLEDPEDPCEDGEIILRCGFRNWGGGGGMNWIDLVQNMNSSWAFVNSVMNLQVP